MIIRKKSEFERENTMKLQEIESWKIETDKEDNVFDKETDAKDSWKEFF